MFLSRKSLLRRLWDHHFHLSEEKGNLRLVESDTKTEYLFNYDFENDESLPMLIIRSETLYSGKFRVQAEACQGLRAIVII